MYLLQSINDGLKILGFDRETIKRVSKEKSLEEIFLSTLFMNYFIVLVVYILSLLSGGISIEGRALNMSVFFGLLMIYPFFFNVVVYITYGFFGIMAELLDKSKHVRPLVSVGFHTAIVYAVLIYIIAIFATFNISLGAFLLVAYMLLFIYTMFNAISTVYQFSLSQTLIIVIIPFLLAGIALLLTGFIFPEVLQKVLVFLFI